MNNGQNAENAAQINAGGGEEVPMEVVPAHLDPVQQGAIIAGLQFQLEQMRAEMNRQRNQHLLGVVPNQNVPEPPPVAEAQLEEITDKDRRRIEGLQRIMRTAPKFHAGSQEPWRAFELKFSAWRTLSRLDNYANQADRKMVLLSCLEGGASRALELHGQNSIAFRQSATLEEYMAVMRNLFSPSAEKDCARAAFKARQQKTNEPPSIYYSEKMSLYLETLNDGTAFNLDTFKEEMYLGLRSKWLRGQVIKSRAATDQELLADLVSATAAGQAMFKASCSEVVSLDGLAVTTQFSKDAENEVEQEGIEGLNERTCFKCRKTGHIAKDCRQKRKEGTERKEGNCNYCSKPGHWARDCFKKQKDKANGTVKKDEKTGQNSQSSQKTHKKRGGNVKNVTTEESEDEEEQLAIEYEEEVDDIARLRGRNRRSREGKAGFRTGSAKQWH